MTTEELSRIYPIDSQLQSVIDSLIDVANAYIVDSPETLQQAERLELFSKWLGERAKQRAKEEKAKEKR